MNGRLDRDHVLGVIDEEKMVWLGLKENKLNFVRAAPAPMPHGSI
jgi:hypothetical protein